MKKMSKATLEQMDAITKDGKNIIVSAGAGSGKTFVLKERVLRKLKSGIKINNLIILTFTKNAASEMKERIRKIIRSNEDVSDQEELLENASITTFDSYANSLVKKYYYLLGIDKNFKIIESNIIDIETNKILDEILLNKYKTKDINFTNFINNYCYKNDDTLKIQIVKMYHELQNKLDRNLDNYINNYFNEEFINNTINEYEDMVLKKIDTYTLYLNELIDYTISDKAIEKITNKINILENITSKDEILEVLKTSLPKNGKTPVYNGEEKDLKEQISNLEKEIKGLVEFTNKELVDQYKSTYESVKVIIDILKELDIKISEFKRINNSYEFSDIAFKAIDLVKNYKEVRDEIKNNTAEIMIDEYQDTNDIQEEFIKYIANNNVYMVGDVKQSIYRFRNANPYIFKNKYDLYKNNIDGYKIDLTANFRSRNEVLNNINNIFSNIMFDDIGGAKYKEEHQMKFGKLSYNENLDSNMNYDMEILNYKNDDTKLYDDVEIESFIIAKDILNKINNNIKVMDKDTDEFRNIKYSDFCILVDVSRNFDKIKQILEYKGIPTTIYKDVSIKDDDEIYILKNIITLLIHINENNIDEDFKHAFMGVARSYIFKINDNDLFDIMLNNTYTNTELYNKLCNIVSKIDSISLKELMELIIEEFDIFNKTINVGDVNNRCKKIEYFVKQAEELNEFGLDIYSMEDYFNQILESDAKLTMSGKNVSEEAVKIMTIHGSKGLEFPFVYMPFLRSSFKGRSQDKFMLTNKYGIVIPYNNGMIDLTYLHTLNDYNEYKECVSEKIRLFYVALTRAREKIILINQDNDKIKPINNITSDNLINIKSYQELIGIQKNYLSKYITNIDINNIDLTKDYSIYKSNNYNDLIDKNNNILKINNIKINNKLLENKHFSKHLNKVIDKDFKNTLDYGTYMHYVFETIDFNNLNLDNLDEDEKKVVNNFLNHEEFKNISNAKIYKEHEIKYKTDDNIMHGFIDLLLEYDDHFDIVDYKLSNVDSEEYVIQLNGYKNYIENKYNKKVNLYLYSIKKDIVKNLK